MTTVPACTTVMDTLITPTTAGAPLISAARVIFFAIALIATATTRVTMTSITNGRYEHIELCDDYGPRWYDCYGHTGHYNYGWCIYNLCGPVIFFAIAVIATATTRVSMTSIANGRYEYLGLRDDFDSRLHNCYRHTDHYNYGRCFYDLCGHCYLLCNCIVRKNDYSSQYDLYRPRSLRKL
ncbi:hypothetical protein QAD02_017660 [Eretmocerus hayati]|uniref:Uncharacterized protein n=1 Tax=Eretmocerus hayati TaxID=131215 RepID=A0ACC2PFN6_9HYME|nr:hypothetical protein QAD02_017660 [Eretmocerus hayati]